MSIRKAVEKKDIQRERDIQTERQRDRETERQRDREIDSSKRK
jgi:hypothetical protein